MPAFTRSTRRVRRAGVTLVELLVVVGIILLVSAVGLTVFTPSLPTRQLREASRELTAMLQGARDRALRNKRPVGVQIERLRDVGDANDPTATVGLNPRLGVRASFVEIPPPYAGDYVESKMIIAFHSPPSAGNLRVASVSAIGKSTTELDQGWIGQFRPGTIIEFGTQGHRLQLLQPADLSVLDDETGAFTTAPGPGADSILGNGDDPWRVACLTYDPQVSFSSNTLTDVYRILRDPVVASAGTVQLPPQVAIDMGASGLANGAGDEFTGLESGVSPRYFTDLPVQIFFGPDGGLEHIRYGGWSTEVGGESDVPEVTERSPVHGDTIKVAPTGPVCLMLGKIERAALNDLNESQIHTWQDPDSLWVTIDPQTGRIKSTENYALFDSGGGPAPYTTGTVATAAAKRAQLLQARKYALDAQALGGR